MSIFLTPRKRHPDLESRYSMLGQYRICASSGAVTLIAARTTTAGHLFSFRWGDSSGAKAFVRYVGAKFILTTAYGSAQETGCDLIIARSYTASHTGATAITVGGNNGKFMTGMENSLLTSCRIANTGALTAGTHTLDADPITTLNAWTGTVGDTIPKTQIGGASSGALDNYGTLFDARADQSPLVLARDEGFVIRNMILMGATGVGRWDFIVEWDEGFSGQ